MQDCAVRPVAVGSGPWTVQGPLLSGPWTSRSLFLLKSSRSSFRSKEISIRHVGTTIPHAESGQDRSRPRPSRLRRSCRGRCGPALLLVQDCLFIKPRIGELAIDFGSAHRRRGRGGACRDAKCCGTGDSSPA